MNLSDNQRIIEVYLELVLFNVFRNALELIPRLKEHKHFATLASFEPIFPPTTGDSRDPIS